MVPQARVNAPELPLPSLGQGIKCTAGTGNMTRVENHQKQNVGCADEDDLLGPGCVG
jgi:hypothetical protein